MDIPWLTALKEDGDGCAFLDSDQMLFECGHSKQGGNSKVLRIHAAVRQNQDIDSVPARLIAGGKKRRQSLGKTFFFRIDK